MCFRIIGNGVIDVTGMNLLVPFLGDVIRNDTNDMYYDVVCSY